VAVSEEDPVQLEVPALELLVRSSDPGIGLGLGGRLGELLGEEVLALAKIVRWLDEAGDDRGMSCWCALLIIADLVTDNPVPGPVSVVESSAGEELCGGIVCAKASLDISISAKTRVVSVLEVVAPCSECMIKTPAFGGSALTILDFQSVTELIELAASTGGGLERLPVPEIVPKCASNIIEMAEFAHAEEVLDVVDSSLVLAAESLVNVGDDGLHISRAVGGHVSPDGLKVLPEVDNCLDDSGRCITSPEDTRFVDHSPGGKSTRVTASHKDPRGLARSQLITTRHGQVNSLSEVDEIIYSLLQGMNLEGFITEVGVWVGFTVETVLNDNGGTILLISKLTIDCPIGKIGVVPICISFSRSGDDDGSTWLVVLIRMPVSLLEGTKRGIVVVNQLVKVERGVVGR